MPVRGYGDEPCQVLLVCQVERLAGGEGKSWQILAGGKLDGVFGFQKADDDRWRNAGKGKAADEEVRK